MSEITVERLTKRYGETLAVDDLSFTVEAGRVTGFLGPNGSGKSTTMRALLGLIRPTSGKALVEGKQFHELKDPVGPSARHSTPRTSTPAAPGAATCGRLPPPRGCPTAASTRCSR